MCGHRFYEVMSAVLGPLHLDQLPKSKPVTPMFSCLVSPWDLGRPKPSLASRYRVNTWRPTPIPRWLAAGGPVSGRGSGQRPGAAPRKPAASGAADVRGDPLNSRTAKAMSPRYPTNQVAHFCRLPEDSSVVPTCP